MKIRFFNANILMLDEKNDFVLGEVCVLDNTIIYVGKEKNKSFLADREINVFGNILMPGFVNAHAHSAMTLFRGVCDDAGLDEWLNDNIVPMEKNLQKNDVYWGTKLAILEQFSAGITTCEDLYFRKEESIKAFVELGQRARIGLGFLGNGENDGEEDVKNFASLKHDLISFVLYAHSIYSCSENEFEKLVAFSKKFRLPVSTHLSETLKEVGDCTVKFLKTPVELLEDYGFLDRFSTLYHCVHMDKDDVTLLSHYGANIVTCPSSNLKLGSGFAPIYSFQNADLNIAIGTDSAASNNSLDMFKEMFLAATLPKACLYDSSVISCKDVLKMATINGAKALGIERIGKIEEGFFADLILIDTTKAHFWPKNNLISNLVYSAKSSDVYLTMINGKIVYESGEFKTCKDVENVFQNCEKIVKRIKGNVKNEY